VLTECLCFEAVDKILGRVLYRKGFWVADGPDWQKDTWMLLEGKRRMLLVFILQQGPNFIFSLSVCTSKANLFPCSCWYVWV